jgi:hypothetical protein
VHCSDERCSTATTTVVHPDGKSPSITIGTDGLALISYFDASNATLAAAHCSNASCTSAVNGTLDGHAHSGDVSSIALVDYGWPLVLYRDALYHLQAVVIFLDWDSAGNVVAVHGQNVPVDAAQQATGSVSIATTPSGHGLAVYGSSAGLRAGICYQLACGVFVTVDASGQPVNPSVTIGVDGLGLIAYKELISGMIKVAHCSDSDCIPATTTTLGTDAGTDQGPYPAEIPTSVTIGSDGLGLVTTTDRIWHCADVACSQATVLDLSGSVSRIDPSGRNARPIGGTFATIGIDGLPLVAWPARVEHTEGPIPRPYDVDALLVTHCANAFCAPYFWRR